MATKQSKSDENPIALGFNHPEAGLFEVLAGNLGVAGKTHGKNTRRAQELARELISATSGLNAKGINFVGASQANIEQLYSLAIADPVKSRYARGHVRELIEIANSTVAGDAKWHNAIMGESGIRRMITDLNTYISSPNHNEQTESSRQMAMFIRKALIDDVTAIKMVSEVPQQGQGLPSKNRDTVLRHIREDMLDGELGKDYVAQIRANGTLSNAIETIVGSTQNATVRKIAQKMLDLSRARDVEVEVLTRADMESLTGDADTRGWYSTTEGKIYVREGMPYHAMVRTLMHEATHVYFARGAFAYHSFSRASLADKSLTPQAFGLTPDEVEFYSRAETLLNASRNMAFDPARFAGIAMDIDRDGKPVPYGVSYEEGHPHAVAEFLAELYGSDKFRQYVEEGLTREMQTNRRTIKAVIRDLWNKMAKALGFRPSETSSIAEFLDRGLRMWDEKPYISATGTGLAVTSRRSLRNGFAEDQKNGVAYYTFKRNGGNREIAGSAKFDEESATWELQWVDSEGQLHTKANLDATDLMYEADEKQLIVYGRTKQDGMSHYLDEQLDLLKMTNPRWSSALEKFRHFLMNFLQPETANDIVARIYDFSLFFENYAMNRDSLFTWVERALTDKLGAGNPAIPDLMKRINDINTRAHTEMEERGLGEKNLYDYKQEILDVAKTYNISVEKLNAIGYALTAKYRKELFDKSPGEINPYTGKPFRDGSQVSGFEFTDENGRTIKDDTGAIYLSRLSPEEKAFAEKFTQLQIAQNNRALDIEHAAGVISTEQYNAMYGLFYAPLRNDLDNASAFYKRALGRTTMAKDPITNYYAHLQARMGYARHSMKIKALKDIALEHNMQNLISINEVRYVGQRAELSRKWNGANNADPTVFTVWEGNTQYVLQVQPEPVKRILARASERQMTGIWNWIAGTTRALSAVRTSLSPTFLPVAFARDLLTSMTNIQAAFRANNGVGAISDEEARQLAFRAPARAVRVLPEILKGKVTGNRSWQYDVFKRVGGGIQMNAKYDFEQANDWLRNELRVDSQGSVHKISAGMGLAKKTLSQMSEISHGFEDAVRFAAFMEYLELRNGGKFNSKEELVSFLRSNPEWRSAAVTGSKNITGNFEIKGSNVGWRAGWMFFNASMVGFSNALHMLDPRHGSHGYKMAGLITALALASLASADADLGDDEDGTARVMRTRGVMHSIGTGGYSVPVPHELRGLTGLAEGGYLWLMDKASLGEAVGIALHGTLQMGSPFQFERVAESQNSLSSLMQSIAPTLAELPIQLMSNTNGFGSNITSEYAYADNGQRIMNAMDWQKTRMNDSYWAKALAFYGQKFFDLDISSSEYEHTAQFFGGSLYTLAKRLGNGMQEDKSPSEIFADTVGRPFTQHYDERAMITKMRNDLREAKAQIMMGEDPNNMVVSSGSLKGTRAYDRIISLEKRIERAEKTLQFNGKSMSDLIRQKQQAEINADYDAIFEANEGIDVLGQIRHDVYGDFYDELQLILEQSNE